MATAQASYDPRSALYAFAPGVAMTREIEAALVAQFASNAGGALTSSQVLAITGPLPAVITAIPRLPETA